MKPHYSDEEANDILRRAIEKMPDKPAMSLEDLEKIGAEIGISPEALRQAEAEHRAESKQGALYQRFLEHERGAFKAELLGYIGTTLFLFGINYVTTHGFWWFIFPALGMGLSAFKRGIRAYSRDSDDHIEAYNRWLQDHTPKVLPPGL
jgi:hypothetical protein